MSAFWDQIEPLLEKVIPTTFGRETVESIRKKIEDKEIILWILWKDINNIEGIVTTKVIEYPDKKVLWRGFLASKNNQLHKWFSSMVDTLSKYAISNDCECIEIIGRKGWMREFNKTKIKLINIGTVYEGKLS